jgi:hypothetical protein
MHKKSIDFSDVPGGKSRSKQQTPLAKRATNAALTMDKCLWVKNILQY